MLTNINNHLSVYEFDTLRVKIVIVVHAAGLKFFLEDLTDTPWAKDNIDPELYKRFVGPDQIRRRGLSMRDHLQAPEHRHGEDPQRHVPEIRAVGRGDGGGIAGQGFCLSEGWVIGTFAIIIPRRRRE